MPFCTQCGNQVTTNDVYCGSCGSRQEFAGAAGSTPPPPRSSAGKSGGFPANIDSRQASIFCYVPWAGWIASIIVLASDRFRDDRNTRFHAFQGLYLFVIWLFVDWVFSPVLHGVEGARLFGSMMKIAVIGAWIFMLVKTSQGVIFRLPFIGELAERSVSEQK
jgi:uncharacterized membrane protein